MSTPRRRSSRLRGSAATPGKTINYGSNRLGSLAEGDETPVVNAHSNLHALEPRPQTPQTPTTTARVRPSLEEMHPSKAQQSTTRKPDSGLRLGFTDVNATGENQPSGITQQTPSKKGIIDSSFQFTFARPAPQLGPDAQRMMDELREEALRIKARLAAEREEEKRQHAESAAVEGRKIAQPKGRAGRFSDIHMAEFRKMDSIAGHPSAFRTQPGRPTLATQNLKRTQSKAQLDDRDETQRKGEHSSGRQIDSGRLENVAPAKRARKHFADDTSSARPVSRGNIDKPLPTTPNRHQSHSVASLTTPTQASLARVATVKRPASQIPMLAKSPSKPNLVETPKRLPKAATLSNVSSLPNSQSKVFLQSSNKLDRVKSILRYPGSAKKSTSIPKLSRSPSKPNFERSLASIPTTPGGVQKEKRVNFTPDSTNRHIIMARNSPSPVKSGIPRSTSKINFGMTPFGQSNSTIKEVQYPIFASASESSMAAGNVEYPSLPGVRPLPEPPYRSGSQPKPPQSVPGTFTFRSDHTINFGRSPNSFGSSPGQASVRQVRQSLMPSNDKMPGTFPSNKENRFPIPSIPHGMSNKKRRRVESDDEDDQSVQQSPKKQKAAEGPMLMAPNLQGSSVTPASTAKSPSKKKGVLSLSRLNMLARPKVRR